MTDVSDLLRAAAGVDASPASQPNLKALEDSNLAPVLTPQKKMAAIADLSDPKMAAVAAASDAKLVSMGGMPNEQTFRNAAISRVTGSGLKSANPIEHDLATLSADELHAKYGFDTGGNLVAGRVRAENMYRQQLSGTRDWGEFAKDSAIGAGLGLTDMVGGIGALALGGLDAIGKKVLDTNTSMGVTAAKAIKHFDDFAKDYQSPVLANRRTATEGKGMLDSRDNEVQAEQDIADGNKPLVASLKKIGRNAIDTAKDIVSDPALLSDSIAAGAGSLLAGGPISKGVSLAAGKVLPYAMRGTYGPWNSASQRIAASIGSKLPGSEAVGVGAMFGGGSFQATAAQIAEMSLAELTEKSPEFRNLVMVQGMSPEDARNQIATNAGLTAAAVAAPVGMAAGAIAKNVIRNPFAGGSVGDIAHNIVASTAEQSLQGAGGQFANNVGIQQYADPNQDLAKGVGEAFGSSAVGGLGVGGALAAPHLAGKALKATGNAAFDAARARTNKIEAANEAQSPSSDANISTAGNQIAEAMRSQDTHNAIADAVNKAPVEQRSAMETLADKITELGHFDHKELTTEGLSPTVKSDLFDMNSRVDAVLRLSNEINEKGAHTEEGLAAARELSKQLTKFEDLVNSDHKAFAEIPESHPANAVVEQFNQLGDRITHNPTILKAIKSVHELSTEQVDKLVKPVSEENLGTKEGKQSVENAVALASIAPEKGNLETTSKILEHSNNGKLQLTLGERQALMTSLTLLQAAKNATERQKAAGTEKPMDLVTRDVLSAPGQASNRKRSALDFAQRILLNMRAGNIEDAHKELENFGMFAQHMSNKSDAVNQHYEQGGGDRVSFKARNPDSNQWYDSTGNQLQGVTPTSPKSVEYAHQVNNEAKFLAEVYNGLSKAFPELNAGERSVKNLHENLQGNPIEVAKAHRADPSLVPTKEAKEAKAATTEQRSNEQDAPKAEAQPKPKESVESAKAGEGAAVSRATPEQLRAASDARLEKTAETLQKRVRDGEASPSDRATLEAVQKESVRRVEALKAEATPTSPREVKGAEAKVETKPTEAKIEPKKPAEATPGEKSAPPDRAQTSDAGAEAVEKAPQPKTVKEAYPNLVGSKDNADGSKSPIKNWFHSAFEVVKNAKETGSRLLGLEKPYEAVRDALRSEEGLKALVGDEHRMAKLPPEVAKAFRGYLNVLPAIRQTLEARVADKLGELNDPKSPGANLLAGKSNRWAETRVFNLLEQQPDGSFKYNPQLLDQAVLAGLHWLLVSNHFKSDMDADLVHALTGIPVDRASDFAQMLNVGLSPVEAVRSLGDRIVDFWGVRKNSDVGIGHTDGIPQAMAAEVLKAFSDTHIVGNEGLLKIKKFVVDGETLRPLEDGETTKKRIVQRLVSNLDPTDHLFAAPSLIEQLVVKAPKDKNFYAGDKIPVADKQMNNPLVENTPAQKTMIQKAQEQAYRLNEKIFNLYNAIGDKGLLELFGGSDLTSRKGVNEQHKLTLEGKNTTVKSAWDALQSRVAEMQTLPDGLASAIHYAFNVSSVGRLQMLGGQTPQLSKLIREAILPTWSTVDLRSNGEGSKENMHFFKLALAQALGVKIHANDTNTIYDQLNDRLTNKFAKSIELLQNHLEDGKKLSPQLIKTLKNEFASAGEDLTPNALHALTEHARWLNSSEAERAKFETSIYVEADGVTNGAANAIRMLTADHFTADQIENMAKTGQFFTDSKTMNDHRSRDSIDLYTKASNFLQSNLDKLFAEHANVTGEKSPMQLQMHRIWSLMDQLVPGVKFDSDTNAINVDRSVTKNPMTMMIYGAGAKAVATKIADDMARAIYQKISEPNGKEQFAEIAKTLNQLLSKAPGLNQERSLELFNTTVPKIGGNHEKFVFSREQFDTLRANIEHLFVNSMRDGIERTMGKSATESAKLIQTAAQVQSIVLEHLFRQRVEQLQAEKAKDPNWHVSDGLSQNDLNGILRDLQKTHPLVTNGEQTFFPANRDTSELKNTTSSGLNGEFKTSPEIYSPSDAGVKSGPMLNIGMGDGSMIQKMLGKLKAAGLPVFDGFNFGLDKIADGSMKANEAAYESWQNNPLKAVFDAFKVFNENLDSKSFKDPKLLKALADALLPFHERKEATADDIKTLIDHMQDKLEDGSKMVEARQKVIQEHQNYTDQMAGAQHPYENKGAVLTGSHEDVANALNTHLEEVLSGKKAEKTETKPVETKSMDIAQVEKQVAFTPEQKSVWDLVQKAGALVGFRIETGPRDDLGANTKGVIDIANNLIHLVHPTGETLVHEAIHAATFDAVLKHYSGESNGPRTKEVSEAVGRLEELMDQFRKLDITETSKKAPDFIDALRAINSGLEKGDATGKAIALNEFMAWTLANKGLTETLKGVEANPLARLAKNVWTEIKNIVFGRSNLLKHEDSLYSNILFNTSVIIHEQPSVARTNREVSLFQNKSYGTNDRLSAINEAFDKMFGRFLGSDDVNQTRAKALVANHGNVEDLAKLAIAQGFYMDQQAHDTFRHVVTALASSMKLDPNSMAAMTELYQHVVQNLTPEKLMGDVVFTQEAYDVAKQRFDMLVGNAGTKMDAQGRSSLMPVFMGLALVDEGLRNVLRDIPLPETQKTKQTGVDGWAADLANQGLRKMSDMMAGVDGAKNVKDAIDNLTKRVAETALDARSTMEEIALAPNSLTNRANDAFVGWLEKITDKVIDTSRKTKANTQSEIVKRAADVAEFMANMVTEKNGQHLAEGLQMAVNRMDKFRPIREMISDIIGRTKSNGDLYDYIKLAASMVGQTRQQFREHLPQFIADQFSQKLDTKTWGEMHHAVGKSDLAALAGAHSPKEVLDMLHDSRARNVEIRKLETFLKSEDADHFDLVKRKAEQLATHMMSGAYGTNLLRNANAVAELLGEKTLKNRKSLSPAYIEAVDRLTSLYALGKVSPEIQASMKSLVQNEAKGMDFVLNYMKGTRNDEFAKATGMALYNATKGYIPAIQQQGVSLRIAHDSEASKLLAQSYIRLGDYNGSSAEGRSSKMGYYFAPVSGRAGFSQGIIQNAAHTAGGVEVTSGRSQGLTGGRIDNPVVVERIAKQLHLEKATNENLIPVYNDLGRIVAFERGVDPSRLTSLNPDTHLARMIGVMRGRQMEEAISGEFNKGLIETAYDMYKTTSPEEKKGYVDLFDPRSYGNDPVIRDAVSLFTPELHDHIRNTFGDRFMVRKDMINDTIGYRKATVGDAWTGNTRWNNQTQKAVRDITMAVFGNKAYQHMLKAEEDWQYLVKEAKSLIVVKSIIVPTSNFASNLFQLAARGVPVSTMVRDMPRKVAEAEAYQKGRLAKIEAEGLLHVAEGAKDYNAQLKLKAKIQTIEDGFKRLSIYPLIKAGEFGSISHTDMGHDDLALSQGRLHDFMTGLVDKLPEGVQKAGNLALIRKDTALFKGLAKAVEYGDFLGKALQYDHYVNQKGYTSEQALARITEEYVNFDRLPGRSRGYLDQMGLMWFMNFKLRTTKVALSMLRENPIQALIGSFTPTHAMGIGTPFSDNIVAKAFSGHLGYSLGPGMMLHAPMLNPVAHVLGKF